MFFCVLCAPNQMRPSLNIHLKILTHMLNNLVAKEVE